MSKVYSTALDDVFRKTDWTLLREQKEYLQAMASDSDRLTAEVEMLDGVLHWIDAIQDAAVEEGIAIDLKEE